MAAMRIAVVGAGSIAQRYHLPALARLAGTDPDLHLAAICDVDAGRAREMATAYGFDSACDDYRRLVDDVAPDAAWVLVPYPRMRQVAGHLLERGLPVLMEKPPGQSSTETRALLEIAGRTDVPHQVALNRRYAPLIRRMRALLGEAGGAQLLSCQFYRYRRLDPAFAFGTGLHGLDALRYLGSSEVCEVHPRPGPRGAALVTLLYASGAIGSFEMFPQVGLQSERYTAHAGDRTVVVDGVVDWLSSYPGFLHCYDGNHLSISEEAGADAPPPEVVGGFQGEAEAFIAALREGRPPSPSLSEALRSVEIAEAVQRMERVVFEG